MYSFRSNKPHSKKRFLVYYSIQFLLAIVLLIVGFGFKIFKQEKLPFYTILAAVTFIVSFLRDSTTTAFNEVIIDEQKQLISFYCYRFWKGEFSLTSRFDETKIDIDPSYSTGLFSQGKPAIFFFKNKPGLFYVSEKKDGFSKKTIAELSDLLKKITSPAAATT